MTTLAHVPAALHLPVGRTASRPPVLRRLARALGRLYADRPLLAASCADDRAALPSRPYADLPSLR